jgi:ferric-dicitrate binding protein FerR (iron transport regulator)
MNKQIHPQLIQDYLEGKLPAQEEARVQEYLAAHMEDPDVRQLLDGWFDECRQETDASGHDALRATRERMGLSRKQQGRVRLTFWLAAAVLALLIVLPFSYKAGMNTGEEHIASIEWVEVNVPFGEKEEVMLSDGTVLHLNSGSRLTYPAVFTGESRTVFMDGEAYLDVAKDPEHPFIIKSQSIDIKVLGTSFNFKNFARERTAELLLMEGSVEASVSIPNDTRTVRLKPGDKMQYNRESGNLDIQRFSPKGYKAFYEDNSLYFLDMELSDIALDLSRRFNREIVVLDEELASRRYFSIFTNNETLDQILAVMSSDGKMRVVHSGKTIYLQPK